MSKIKENNIINVRGTSGSGKTTLVKRLIQTQGIEHNLGKKGLILHGNIAVVGKYDNPCGGCDTMKSQQDIMDTIEEFFKRPDCSVIFEGLMISTVHSTWVEFAKKFGHNFHVIYLNTPLEQCLQNIETRRVASGKTYKPLNVENISGKHKSILFQHSKEGFVNKHLMSPQEAFNFIIDLCKQITD